MQYTEQQMSEFREQFRAKRKRQIILAIPVVLCMLVLFALGDKNSQGLGGLSPEMLLPPIFLLIVAAVGYSFYNWRCPACKKYLGKTISPSFCTRCGVALQ